MSRSSTPLADLWTLAEQPPEALRLCRLVDGPAAFASSFAIDSAAQTSIAAAALAASELGHMRGAPRQRVTVNSRHAALEASGWFTLDGHAPELWDEFSGLYRCRDGHVRLHANFAHHREGALRLLGVSPLDGIRADAEAALDTWSAFEFEEAAAERGLVAAAVRSFDAWDASPQGIAVAAQPVMTIERIGDADPLPLPSLAHDDRPLSGLRVLDLTRILAGPTGGRLLAAFGAEVMLVNSPQLPNIAAIAETSRGKRSAHLDLNHADDRSTLWRLIKDAHVFVQGYRPGALAGRGFSPCQVAGCRPGIVQASLSAYGTRGPWTDRRGFDSLVQAAMGFNDAEGAAFGEHAPRALPVQILDQCSGFLIAFGVATALRRQQTEGGSWHVQVSLAQTAQWLRGLTRCDPADFLAVADMQACIETSASGFGLLRAVRPSAQFEHTPARHARASVPPGTDDAAW